MNGSDERPALILIDSDVLIDAARLVADAVECLREVNEQSSGASSAVSYMELIVGCRDRTELRRTERFLRRYELLNLEDAISREAIGLLRQYRLSHGLLMPDALIAATALVKGLPLVTQNQRDFRFITNLRLLPYPRPFGVR